MSDPLANWLADKNFPFVASNERHLLLGHATPMTVCPVYDDFYQEELTHSFCEGAVVAKAYSDEGFYVEFENKAYEFEIINQRWKAFPMDPTDWSEDDYLNLSEIDFDPYDTVEDEAIELKPNPSITTDDVDAMRKDLCDQIRNFKLNKADTRRWALVEEFYTLDGKWVSRPEGYDFNGCWDMV